MEYIKLKISVKDRILLLLFGLISKSYLINNNKEIVADVIKNDVYKSASYVDVPDKPVIIPFFDFAETDSIKSNLK